MKNRFFTLLLGMALFGCSSDDNSGGNNDTGAGTYLPQQQGNYWVYDVESEEFSGRDSLYVSGTTTSQGNTYYTYSTLDFPYGFYSELMTSGGSRSSGSKIFMTGAVGLGDLFGLDFGSDINLDDFVIFDSSASQGTILDSEVGSFMIPYSDEMELLVEYSLSSKAGQNYPNYTVPNGNSYENVKSVTIAVSTKITAYIQVFGFTVPYVILNNQDVLSSTQYYAKDIGVVYVNTDFQYHLNEVPIPEFDLPIPQNFQSNTTETLDDYLVE